MILEYTDGMTRDQIIEALKTESGIVHRDGAVVEVRLKRTVTAADIDDTRGVPDAAFNPNSFMGAAELSGREIYRRMGGAEASAAISNVVNWGEIMNAVHFLKDDPSTGIVRVVKRMGEPFMVYFTTPEKADAFAREITGTEKWRGKETGAYLQGVRPTEAKHKGQLPGVDVIYEIKNGLVMFENVSENIVRQALGSDYDYWAGRNPYHAPRVHNRKLTAGEITDFAKYKDGNRI